ncbi:MAG: nucleotidyltransferase domain-containing protein [Chitinispirillaceae bacterium]|nr:nucleotidyltransferase domain-containing protein [Chitinispirillaceae bacterium]
MPFNWEAAAKNLKRRFTEERKQRLSLYKKATSDCKEIIEMIIKEFNPKRIYIWGSLLDSEKFDQNSDIDIAIEGLKNPKDWFDIVGKAMKITLFPLDIIELENIDPIDRSYILSRGKLVYERGKNKRTYCRFK